MADNSSSTNRISARSLDALFPMHAIVDDRGVIRRVGPTLSKVLRCDVTGRAFLDAFEIRKPRSIIRFEQIADHQGQKIIVRTMQADGQSAQGGGGQSIEFRCVAVPLEDRQELLIDFAFSTDFVDLIAQLELNASDFKPNDLSLDLIYTVETQRTLVEDSYKLTAALEQSKKQAEHAANIDPLTGIANRRSLYRFLSGCGLCSKRQDGCFLLHLDLDKFKSINDNCGHAAGDGVLQRLAMILRQAANEEGFAARLGGDEFVLVLPGPRSVDEISKLAKSICRHVVEPIEFEGHVLQVDVSIGVVEFGGSLSAAPDELLNRSDIALYEAKRRREQVVFLTPEMLRQYNDRSVLIQEIEIGLKQRQFVPFFQPKVDTLTGAVKGIEVLARWQHPTRGLLAPAVFIEIAESANLMGAIDRSIIIQAIAAFRDWRQAGYEIGRLSINITAANLNSLSFAANLVEELNASDLAANDIELELLESIIFDGAESSLLGRCQELRDAGFHLSLDDFGTGYASISSLIDNTISTIKIDRSFISGIDKQPRLQRITRSIMALSQQLGLEVVAEGVETFRELEVLSAFGCHIVQGYYFSPALDCQNMTSWLKAWDSKNSNHAGFRSVSNL